MMVITAQQIADVLHAQGFVLRLCGDGQTKVSGFSSIFHYKENTMTFVVPERSFADYADRFFNDTIALMILADSEPVRSVFCASIIVKDPRAAFFSVVEHVFAPALVNPTETTIGLGSYVSENVKLGKCVIVGRGCVLDGDITVGDYTCIGHNAVIENHVVIGAHCEIDACTVIGTDGFNIQHLDDGKKGLTRHYGGVTIGSYVHIGEHTHVNRGMLDDTIIGDYSKIDGLCHVAHNVQIGRGCLVIAGAMLYGSAVLEDNTHVSTSVIRNQCTVGEGAMVGIGAVVTKDVPPNKVVCGNPAKILRDRF